MKNTYHKITLLLLLLSIAANSYAQTQQATFIFKVTASGITENTPVSLNNKIDYTSYTTHLFPDDIRICYFQTSNNPSWGTVSLHYRMASGILSVDFLPQYGSTANRNVYNLFYTKARLRNGDNILKLEVRDNLIWITCNEGSTEQALIENNGTGEGILWENNLALIADSNLSVNAQVATKLAAHTSPVTRRLSDHYEYDPVYDEYGYGDDDLTQPIQLGNGLHFDGSNDYVSIPASSSFSFGTGDFTLETWVKCPTASGNLVVIGRYNGSGNDYWLGMSSNKAHFSINGTGITGGKTISDGNWHHIAGVRSSGVLSLYVDGIPDAANVSNTLTANPGGALNIGAFNAGHNFPGAIDEARIWNTALSQEDIQVNMNLELEGDDAGLVAYYTFDHGTACGSNSGIVSLADITGHGHTGTLTNFALSGTTTNWVPGVTPPSYDTICIGDVTDLDNYRNDGVWSSSNTGIATVSSTGLVAGIAAGTASINYTIPNANGCPSVSSTIITVYALPTTSDIRGNGLYFDGVDDYVNVPTNTNIPVGNATYSIEAWIKPTIHTKNGIVGWGNWGTNKQTNTFNLGDNNTVANGWTGNQLKATSGNLADGIWHHVAATFDGITRKIYVDGVLKAQDNPTGHNVPNANNLKIGIVYGSSTRIFKGSMDEVRIWNVARTEAQIQSGMYTELAGNEPGLVAYYNFNSGVATATNTGVTTAADKTSNNNIGTLTNFGLTGATSNWVAGSSVIPRTTVSNGLNFDGTNDYVKVTTSTNFPIGNSNYTLEAWIKPNTHTRNGIIGWGQWWANGGTNALRLGDDNTIHNYWWSNDLVVTSGNLVDGKWHHIAATFDGTTRKIYVDGAVKGQDNPTGHNVTQTDNICIGRTYTNEYFNGKMDEVRVWNIARTQAEIRSAMYTEMSGTEAGLASYYNFNQGIADSTNTGITFATDKTASINSGILTNFALTGTTSNWTSGSIANTGAEICGTGSFQLNNAVSGGAWSSSNTGVATVSSTGLVTGVSSGTASIIYTNTNPSDCAAASEIPVSVTTFPSPSATASPASICIGSSTTLSTPQVAGATYKWATTPNGTSIGNQSTLTISPSATTTYYVTVTNNSGCSGTSGGVTVNVSANTMVTLPLNSSVAQQVTVGPNGKIYTILNDDRVYLWNGSSWTRISNSIYASSIAVHSNGNLWWVAKDGTNEVYFILCNASGMPVSMSTEFYQSSALKVACGANGTVAIIGTDNKIWKWNGNVGSSGNSSSFTQYSNTNASDVAVDPSGRIWYVDRTDHDINYLSSGQWITLNSITGNQVACGTDGSVYVTGWSNNAIYKWDGSAGFNVVATFGTANTDLTVYNANSIIKLDSGLLYKTSCFNTTGSKSASEKEDNQPSSKTILERGQLVVYPNPNNGMFSISFNLIESSTVIFRLVDVQGRVVHKEMKEATAGNQTYNLAAQNLSPGIYFLKIDTREFSKTEKVSIEK